MFVTNSHGEKLLISRLLQLSSQNNDKVSIVSLEGSSYELSKVTFNFISHLSVGQDVDKILTYISEDNLANIIRFLSFQDNFESIHIFNEDARSLGINLNQLFKSSESVSENNLTRSQSEESAKFFEESVSTYCAGDEQAITEISTSEETCDSGGDGVLNVECRNESDSANEDVVKEERVQKKVRLPTMKTKPSSWKKKKYRLTIGDPEIVWHVDMHVPQTIKCQLCGKRFDLEKYSSHHNHKVAYIEHYQKHEMEATECGCEIKFESFKERQNHWQVVHKGYEKCDHCSYSYENLADHMLSIHRSRSCDQCEFKTKRGSYALKQHIRSRHNKELKSTGFSCADDECEKMFPNKGQANSHFNKVHTKGAPCPECGKDVKRLQLHIDTIHRSNKKYQCDKCSKAFANWSQLRNHELVDHEGIRYKCRYSDCQTKDQEYRDPSNRSAHERKRHGGVFIATLL